MPERAWCLVKVKAAAQTRILERHLPFTEQTREVLTAVSSLRVHVPTKEVAALSLYSSECFGLQPAPPPDAPSERAMIRLLDQSQAGRVRKAPPALNVMHLAFSSSDSQVGADITTVS